ncbi:DNA-binding protein [Facilibium subflavum]|uniref:DNA-binding protein n=1 Tax=Facilibium subflavum TaxID=2219058 RepID=UPI000E6592A5|nr:DNA-binding protein [Facilibium subflavum]
MQHTLTTESIHAMADKLIAEGKRPTLALLRQELGGGSYTTISEAMKLWREEKARNAIAPIAPMPEDVITTINDAAQQIWQTAMTVAENKLQSERDALKEARLEMDIAQNEAIEMADQLDREVSQLKQKLDDATNSQSIVNNENISLKSELSDLKKDLATAHKAMTKLEKESKEANSKMIESLQESANLKGQVEALEKVLNQSKSK